MVSTGLSSTIQTPVLHWQLTNVVLFAVTVLDLKVAIVASILQAVASCKTIAYIQVVTLRCITENICYFYVLHSVFPYYLSKNQAKSGKPHFYVFHYNLIKLKAKTKIFIL